MSTSTSGIAPAEQAFVDYRLSLSPDDREAAGRRVEALERAQTPLEEVAERAGLQFEPNLGELLQGGIPEPERLIPNVIYENRVHWLSGHPGAGKTTLAMWVARQHMQAGGHVIWFDWEAGIRPTVARLAAVGATAEQLDSRFHLAAGVTIPASAEGFGLIADALERYPGALVVFDSASKALSLAGFDENSSTEATKWTTNIVLPTRDAGGTVIVIDHVTKGANRSNPYPRGAGSKLADTDAHWYVDSPVKFAKDRIGRIELVGHKDRDGLLPERVAFEVGDGAGNLPLTQVEVEDEGSQSKREAGLRDKVQAVLAEHSSPEKHLTTNQIAELVSSQRSAAIDALKELAADKSAPVVAAPGPNRSVEYWHDPSAVTGIDIRGEAGAEGDVGGVA